MEGREEATVIELKLIKSQYVQEFTEQAKQFTGSSKVGKISVPLQSVVNHQISTTLWTSI